MSAVGAGPSSAALLESLQNVAPQAGRLGRAMNGFYRSVGKRAFDFVFALALIPILLPVIVMLSLLVALDGGRPFYAQKRVGRAGRVFNFYKIRSMAVDAETRLEHLLETDPEAADQWRRHRKLMQDPRITPIGRSLRKTGLDELPQVFNILRGDMSFVGPRPLTGSELGDYEKQGYCARSYCGVRPGLTGPWQIAGRRSGDQPDRFSRDRLYVREMSFTGDLLIILKTVPEAVLARGR